MNSIGRCRTQKFHLPFPHTNYLVALASEDTPVYIDSDSATLAP